jgi:hypothetical protein
MPPQPMISGSRTAATVADGAIIGRRIRISQPDEGRGRCKGSRAWDPRTYFRIGSDITSAFEGGSVGSLNLVHRGIISYGRHRATLASSGPHELLAAYLRLLGSVAAIRIGTYRDRVRLRDPTLSDDETFIRLLRDATADPAMALAQDEQALARLDDGRSDCASNAHPLCVGLRPPLRYESTRRLERNPVAGRTKRWR